ncbi:MAG: 2'-5' RNA ligase family protein [Flavobacterium sp.]|nr:MAG: 2'-5' RNA ligase family protein [Flavobacterium sp.]
MEITNTLYEPALIVTVQMDEASQNYFNALRTQYFPPERNFLNAHLTLFHKLPDTPETAAQVASVAATPFTIQVRGLINLGAGVAFRIESEILKRLRSDLARLFKDDLSAQDRQGFRGHITVSNKTRAELARKLLAELSLDFKPFEVNALGLDLWRYLGGSWEHIDFIAFR